ncbi:recombination and DNA strand exchange inhibitor protein [Jeotgalibacillus alimentarius]|uniref:Recombination and DNA strand exchange inhibitor protein n=1 Tax=Jeotgalibacillus alimentarius TaxID=135826 RepID=A0A0C2VSK5_9BACL|nr:hypothetical protein [Jeotgalibacillus alimentarius]KIL46958.1 recombination and DNA strand exchange inhibitor protein [Jeotgalibacillus alimentarius]
MGGTSFSMSYKQLHATKHALKYYMMRPGISEADKQSEQALLDKVVNEIEDMKERYKIGCNEL